MCLLWCQAQRSKLVETLANLCEAETGGSPSEKVCDQCSPQAAGLVPGLAGGHCSLHRGPVSDSVLCQDPTLGRLRLPAAGRAVLDGGGVSHYSTTIPLSGGGKVRQQGRTASGGLPGWVTKWV